MGAKGKGATFVTFVKSEESTSQPDYSSAPQAKRHGSMEYTSISESNVGFQLLKKAGWREGTGLGVAEQGQLHPVETYLKRDKRGIGAERRRETKPQLENPPPPPATAKNRKQSKAARKAAAEEARYQEQDFARSFFREFYPDNV